MIVFCEDCGAQNPYTPDTGRRIRFTCRNCGYVNAYLPDRPEPAESPPPFDKDLEVLIQTHDALTGAFVYHLKKKVILSRMPGPLTAGDIDLMGRFLSTALVRGKDQFADTDTFVVSIGKKFITVLMADQELALITVTEPQGLSGKQRTACLGFLESLDGDAP